MNSIRATSLLFLLPVVAVGCGDNTAGNPSPLPETIETIEEFIALYARGLCEKMRECEAWAAEYTQEECEGLVVADLSAAPSITSGAVALDPAAAQACLGLLAAGPACAASPASDDYCFEEGGAFVGTSGVGSACDSNASFLCAPGTECSAEPFSGACGTCQAVPLVDPGEPCQSTANCRQTATTLAYCDFDPVDGRDECVAWNAGYTASLGESCEPIDAYCEPGTQCDWSGTGNCVAQIAIGEECDPNGELSCVREAPCVEDGASSLGGICRKLAVARSVGDECGLVGTDFVECSSAHGLTCDEVTSLCVAAVEAGIGESCVDIDCAAGLTCDYPTCVAQLADGQPCDNRSDCLSGFCFGPDGSSVCGDAASVAQACAP